MIICYIYDRHLDVVLVLVSILCSSSVGDVWFVLKKANFRSNFHG